MATVTDGVARRGARWGRDVKTLGAAWREFARKRSPWIIGSAIVAAAALRLAIGDIGWRDAVAAAAMLVVYPFGEWAIHVYLLHMRPFRIGGGAGVGGGRVFARPASLPPAAPPFPPPPRPRPPLPPFLARARPPGLLRL